MFYVKHFEEDNTLISVTHFFDDYEQLKSLYGKAVDSEIVAYLVKHKAFDMISDYFVVSSTPIEIKPLMKNYWQRLLSLLVVMLPWVGIQSAPKA